MPVLFGCGATWRSKNRVAGSNQDKSRCTDFIRLDGDRSGEQDASSEEQSQYGAALQGHQRAKDLKTNTRTSKNLPVIQVNSLDLICFVSFSGHCTSCKQVSTAFKRKNNLRNGLYLKETGKKITRNVYSDERKTKSTAASLRQKGPWEGLKSPLRRIFLRLNKVPPPNTKKASVF